MPKRFTTVSLSVEDAAKIDEAMALLQKVHGFAPESRAGLIRIAVRDLAEKTKRELHERGKEIQR